MWRHGLRPHRHRPEPLGCGEAQLASPEAHKSEGYLVDAVYPH